MARAKSLINVTFSATGEVYERGKIYDVPAETLKKYPADFKKMVERCGFPAVDPRGSIKAN